MKFKWENRLDANLVKVNDWHITTWPAALVSAPCSGFGVAVALILRTNFIAFAICKFCHLHVARGVNQAARMLIAIVQLLRQVAR